MSEQPGQSCTDDASVDRIYRRLDGGAFGATSKDCIKAVLHAAAVKKGQGSTGAEMIADERERQIAKGYTAEHEDAHDADGELIRAASCYLNPPLGSGWGGPPPSWWPWEPEAYKPRDYGSNLVRAGALIAAELDRLHRRG